MGNVVGNVIRKRVVVRDGSDVVADTSVDIEYRDKTVRDMLKDIESKIPTPADSKLDKFMFTITDQEGDVTELDFTEDILSAKIDPTTTNPKIQQLLRSSSTIIMQLVDTSSSKAVTIVVIIVVLLILALVLTFMIFKKRGSKSSPKGSKGTK
jgi:hypothetical protein